MPWEQAGQVEKAWLHEMRWARATIEKVCKGVVGRESAMAGVSIGKGLRSTGAPGVVGAT